MLHENNKDLFFDYPRDSIIPEIFEQVVKRYPENIAVTYGDKFLSYRDLNARANIVASSLLESGVQQNHYVGICSTRSLEMIVGLLAILKIGAVYVPLDFSLPSSHLTLMIQDALIKVCIVGRNASESQKLFNLDYININDIQSKDSSSLKFIINDPEAAAYVNFSSGTTGKPKGIICTHRGVIRLLFNQNYINFNSSSVILQTAPISFDAATFEIWGALLHGGKCVLSIEHPLISTSGIKNNIYEDKVNTIFLTSALFNKLIDIDVSSFDGLETLLFGGDVASIKHIQKFYRANKQINLINCYGPTENTTFTTYYPIPKEITDSNSFTIPIGKPINHTQVYILNDNTEPVGQNEIGEIYLGGDGLAQGYLNNSDLTSKSFIENAFVGKSIRLYKTGDLGRFRADGQIEFIGRRDLQVKINGYRVDVGEIENCINAHNAVNDSSVLVHEYDSKDKFLVAFIQGQDTQESELKNYLTQVIPNYLIPKKIIWIKSLPITTTGKVDRAALKRHLFEISNKSEAANLNL
jgi:amino acid adenylation domain-containing protein